MGQGKRSDIFWRSSQSGGRATQRTKKGVRTYGSYGDIAAIDPIGEPLLKLFTIELKRGSSHSSPGDVLDFKTDNLSHPWIKCLFQAIRSHKEAGSKDWMMICRRDHRIAMVYLGSKTFKLLSVMPPWTRFKWHFAGGEERADFVGLQLDHFLSQVSPRKIIWCLKQL